MFQGDNPSSGGSTPIPSSKPPPPSSPPATAARRASNPFSVPDPSPADPSESSTIQQHLDRRRKSFHLPSGKKKPSLADLRADSEAAAWHEQMNDVDDVEVEEEELERGITFDMEELRRTMPEAVKMLQAGGEEWAGVDLDEGLKNGYAWDVMFENQRGIHFLGKAYFGANSLLPSDPSHYTVPGRPIPKASTLIVSTDPEPSTSAPAGPNRAKAPRIVDRLHKPKADPSATYDLNYGEHKINLSSEHRNIKTAYSLSTFQCPGPQWEWVTPWMINMKVGTDEGGWRYNAWFKNKGWRNHAGPAGWAGWVRRREWVRLRMVRPIGDEEGEETEQNVKDNEGNGSRRKALSDVLAEAEEAELDEVLHVMSSISLDREKLVWWTEGLEKADEALRSKLQTLLDDSENVKLLHRAFTHRSTFSAFLVLLQSHQYTIAPLPPSYIPPPHPTSPTP